KLFPNPSSGNITIESDPELIGEMLYIFNTDGKEMLSLLINSPRSTIYTGKLHSGLYLASIKGIVRLILIEKE
ncbi:MAG: T9SS type A sorting domain-containing protein, partial [Bacteroidetes bacterium]|nr:T9SS type A sorting domain-containing protein [Bacteroidota bacterium]